jgi:hypothetical protein
MRALIVSKVYAAIAGALLIGAAMPIGATSQIAPQEIRGQLLPAADFLSPIHIAGEVKEPGTFPVIDSPTLAQVFEMAGGLTGNAGPTAILVHYSDNAPLTPPSRVSLLQLVRAGSAVPSNVKLTRIALTGNRALDRRLDFAPQDILFVPAKNEG